MGINILSISDIHLGHKKTTTDFIINNLNKYVTNDLVLKDINLLFIVGDLFDQQLTLSSKEIILIDLWIAKLLKLCKKYNISLRVLEGTPSHDRKQSERFITISSIMKDNYDDQIDVKYVDNLSIEYLDKYNINILYVPDEWSNSVNETFIQVKNLLKSKSLSKVDYSLIHGMFDFQCPDIKNIEKHSSKDYLEITNNLVFIGHIHQHSKFDRIISHGSFDRLSHNEEEPKGFIIANIDKEFNVKFIENKNAKKYITINISNLNSEDALNKIDKVIKKIPKKSFIRLKGEKNNSIFNNLNFFRTKYEDYFFSTKVIDVEEKYDIVKDVEKTYTPIILNENNLKTLLVNRINSFYKDINLLSKIESEIDNCISNLY